MSTQNFKILVIEDEVDLLEIMTDILSDYTVDPASSLTEAREKLKASNFDLIITDMNLSDSGMAQTSVQFVRGINTSAPIFIMTGLSDIDPAVVVAMSHGAQGFIGKPFAAEEVLAKVQGIFLQKKSA